jgi:hypothetical protein
LETLELGKNELKKIPELDFPELYFLDISRNSLNEIPELKTPKLRILCVDKNELKSLPLSLKNLENVECFHYEPNPIESIPPEIDPWIYEMDNITISRKFEKDKIRIYNKDEDNMDNMSISNSMNKSICAIMKTDTKGQSLKKTIKEINNDVILTDDTKEIIIDRAMISIIIDRVMIKNPKRKIAFGKLLNKVWWIIKNHSSGEEIKRILNYDANSLICCDTGKNYILVNVLNGFDDRVQMKISNMEAIGNIIILTRNKIVNYSVNAHRELFMKEMEEREYDRQIIEEWMKYIE